MLTKTIKTVLISTMIITSISATAMAQSAAGGGGGQGGGGNGGEHGGGEGHSTIRLIKDDDGINIRKPRPERIYRKVSEGNCGYDINDPTKCRKFSFQVGLPHDPVKAY